MLNGCTLHSTCQCKVDAHHTHIAQYLSVAGGWRRTSLSPSWVPALCLSQLATGFSSVLTSICCSLNLFVFTFHLPEPQFVTNKIFFMNSEETTWVWVYYIYLKTIKTCRASVLTSMFFYVSVLPGLRCWLHVTQFLLFVIVTMFCLRPESWLFYHTIYKTLDYQRKLFPLPKKMKNIRLFFTVN